MERLILPTGRCRSFLLLAYVFIISLLDTFQGAPHCYEFTDFNWPRYFVMGAKTPTHIWRTQS